MPRTPKDHYVPKAYLRGIAPEYLQGKKGGILFQYYPLQKSVKGLSINDYIACEPHFYAAHPIDKHWSQTIEQRWPAIRDRLKARGESTEVLDQLFWFASAQIIRTPLFMNNVAERISASRARVQTFTNPDGTKWTGQLFDMVHTGDVMQIVANLWPGTRRSFAEEYSWTVYHNDRDRLFITSDNPCRWNLDTNEITMPVALDMVMIGKSVPKGGTPYFKHATADYDLIGKVNRGTVQACTSWIYAHEETPELLRFAVKNSPRPQIGQSMIGQSTGRKFTTRVF